MKFRKLLVIASAAAMLVMAAGTAHAAKTFVRISTSTVGGGFYLVGNTIAQLGQAKMPDVNFTAVTGGSIKNMMNLEKGDVELGLTQSSTLAMGIAGVDTFKRPLKKLRYVSSIYPMPAHILIGTKAGITSVADFKGKHIDFGSVGQGIEVNVRELMSMYGLTDKDVKIERFGRSEFEEAFNTGRIEGTLWTTTIPNSQIADLIRTKTATLLSMETAKLEEMLAKYPHYIKTTIPANTYEGITADTQTFGAVGSLLTHEGVSEELIYNITKMIHENGDFLRERMPSYFANLSLENALSGMGDTILHPGAARYYKEKGLIQ